MAQATILRSTSRATTAPQSRAAHPKTAPRKLFNTRLNKMGCAAFDGRFGTMSQAADFLVHQLPYGSVADRVTIQSQHHIGWINQEGTVYLSPSVQLGAGLQHMDQCSPVDCLTWEELIMLRTCIFSTAEYASKLKSVLQVLTAC